MRKIESIIRSEKTKELIDALRVVGIGGITITEVKGFGKQTTRPDSFLILPKTKIEIYVLDEQVTEITETIMSVCSTGNIGDGKIAVLPVEDMIRIRTKENNEQAIY